MKKNYLFLFLFLLGITRNVLAKDLVYSINKYLEERLTKIEVGYNYEGQIDGMVTAGTILEEKKEEDLEMVDDSVILMKYGTDGKVEWTYSYGELIKDHLVDLDYTYDLKNRVDGYLLTVEVEETTPKTVFLKLDLQGELVWEKESDFLVQEIVPVSLESQQKSGYIAITTEAFTQFDQDMNVIWSKNYVKEGEYSYKDIFPFYEEEKLMGYIMARFSPSSEMIDIILLKIDGSEQVLVSSNDKTLSVQPSKEGFILYGITDKVKLKKGNASYYLINYDKAGTILWESIGETAINEMQRVLLLPQNSGSYFLLYQSQEDKSFEVIQLNHDGLFEKKVKKIKNDYYTFDNYSFIGDTLYFVGQIDCPEKENCDYHQKSLFLISDEDKVIEVKDQDGIKIMITMMVVIGVMFSSVLLKRKRLKKKNA